MGKGIGNKASSRNRRLKKHMQKNLGFSTSSETFIEKLKKERLRKKAEEENE